MPTMQQLETALRNAHAAGDTAAARQLAQAIQAQRQQQPATQPEEPSGGFMQGLANLGAGALRGAGSIGATMLAPIDAAARAVGIQNSIIGRDDRRQAMTEGLRSMGADPESFAFQAGKIGTEIAGTMGAPGAAANVLGRIAPAAAMPVVNALRTGGAAGGGLMSRVAGGAAAGGVQSAMVDPSEALAGAAIGGGLPLAGAAIRGAGIVGRNILGMTTGVGDEALRVGYESGRAGGEAGRAFRQNMRGEVPITDVLDDARANLETLRQARSAAYRQNMQSVRADQSVLDLAPIEQAVQDSIQNFTFKGQARNPQVLRALQSADETVAAWRQLDPTEFHTPEGLDALKQQLGALRDSIPIEDRASRAALDNIYNSTKRQIERQAPEYSKAMREYTEASELISEIQRSLLGNERTAADTAMRKLQSLMRNNVNTNYGARLQAAQALESQGGRQIMPQLAGQQVNDMIPRGIQRGTGVLTAMGGASLAGIPGLTATLAASSPRIVGEAVHGMGRTAGLLAPVADPMRQFLYRSAPVGLLGLSGQ